MMHKCEASQPGQPNPPTEKRGAGIFLLSDDSDLFFSGKGQTAQLKVEVRDAGGMLLSVPISYRSLNPGFIDVTAEGLVEVVGEGLGSTAIEINAIGGKLYVIAFVAEYSAKTTILRSNDIISYDVGNQEATVRLNDRTEKIGDESVVWSGSMFGIIGRVTSTRPVGSYLILELANATWLDAVDAINVDVTIPLQDDDPSVRSLVPNKRNSNLKCEQNIEVTIPFPYTASLPASNIKITKGIFNLPTGFTVSLLGDLTQVFGFDEGLKFETDGVLSCSLKLDFVVYAGPVPLGIKVLGLTFGATVGIETTFGVTFGGAITIPLPKLTVSVPVDAETRILPSIGLPVIREPNEFKDVDVAFGWGGQFSGSSKVEVTASVQASLNLNSTLTEDIKCGVKLLGFEDTIGWKGEAVIAETSSVDFRGPDWTLGYERSLKIGPTSCDFPGFSVGTTSLFEKTLVALILAQSPELKVSPNQDILRVTTGEPVALEAIADFSKIRENNALCALLPTIFCPKFTKDYTLRVAKDGSDVTGILSSGQFEKSNVPTTFVDPINVQFNEDGTYLVQLYVDALIFSYGSPTLKVIAEGGSTPPPGPIPMEPRLSIDPSAISDGEIDKEYDFTIEVSNIPSTIKSLDIKWSFGTDFLPETGQDTVDVLNGKASLVISNTYSSAGAYALSVLVTDGSSPPSNPLSLETDVYIVIGQRQTKNYDLDVCDIWKAADTGGQGVTFGKWDVSKIPPGALFDIRYEAFQLPDKFTAEYPPGNEVVNTGWRGDEEFNNDPGYPGGISGPGNGELLGFAARKFGELNLDTIVYGIEPTTEWEYEIRCRITDQNPICNPQRPAPQCTYCCGAPNPNSCQDCGFSGYDDCVSKTTCTPGDPYLEPYGGSKGAYCACLCRGQGCPP